MKRGKEKMSEIKIGTKAIKALAFSQIFMFIISSFAFAFILGGMMVLESGSVSATLVKVVSSGETFFYNGNYYVSSKDVKLDSSDPIASQQIFDQLISTPGQFTKLSSPPASTANLRGITFTQTTTSSGQVILPGGASQSTVTIGGVTSIVNYGYGLNDLFNGNLNQPKMPSALPTTSPQKIPDTIKSQLAIPAEPRPETLNTEIPAAPTAAADPLNQPTTYSPIPSPTPGQVGAEINAAYKSALGEKPATQTPPADPAPNQTKVTTSRSYNATGFLGSREMPYWLGGLYEGITWAAAVTVVTSFLEKMLPAKQQGLIKPLGQALSAGLFAGKTTWGLLKQAGVENVGTSKYQITTNQFSYGVGFLVAYLVFANQYTKEKSKEASIEFKCMPWQAPRGGADCNKCNTDSLKPCSEYRCKSLGQTCMLINKGSGQERCIDSSPKDTTSPGIKPWLDALTTGYEYTDKKDRPPGGEGPAHVTISDPTKGDGCLKAFTAFNFGIITTDIGGVTQPAQCKVDYNHTANFNDMSYYLGDNNLYLENHSQSISLPGTDLLNSTFPGVKNDGEYTLYVRCKDGNGNENRDEYAVRFCIDKSKDMVAPVIEKVSIPSGNPVLYKVDNLSVGVYTNEPSTCKWGRKSSSYDNMENIMTCNNAIFEMNTELLYTCRADLTGIKDKEENNFFFRCRDLSNNTMQQSYEYKLIGTQPLDILSTGPTGVIGSSTSTATVSLNVNTDNGYKNGEATCFYSTTDLEKDYIAMFATGTNAHSQDLDLTGGDYKYYFKCIDAGGNAAYNSTNFSVYIDKYAPQIARAYMIEDKLIITTNEQSTCAYSTESCNFNIEEGINMPIDATINHYTDWNSEQTYYIKCKDLFENQAPECSMIIRPYLLPENVN